MTTKSGGYKDTVKLSVYKKYETPSAPTLASKTTTSVTLNSVAGCKYSKDGVNWQDSNVFTGLTANTAYTFYVKKVANGYWLESDKSEDSPLPQPKRQPVVRLVATLEEIQVEMPAAPQAVILETLLAEVQEGILVVPQVVVQVEAQAEIPVQLQRLRILQFPTVRMYRHLAGKEKKTISRHGNPMVPCQVQAERQRDSKVSILL